MIKVRVIDNGTDCGTGTVVDRKGELVAVRFDVGCVLWLDVNRVEILKETLEETLEEAVEETLEETLEERKSNTQYYEQATGRANGIGCTYAQ